SRRYSNKKNAIESPLQPRHGGGVLSVSLVPRRRLVRIPKPSHSLVAPSSFREISARGHRPRGRLLPRGHSVLPTSNDLRRPAARDPVSVLHWAARRRRDLPRRGWRGRCDLAKNLLLSRLHRGDATHHLLILGDST